MRYLLLSVALVLTSSVGLAQGQGNQLFAQQWVMATADGGIDAAIVAPGLDLNSLSSDQFRVSLVSQDGAIFRAEPKPDSVLELTFSGVPGGVYSLVVRGPSLVACYAVHVLDNSADDVDPRHNLLAIAVSNMRLNKVRNAVIRYMPSSIPFVAEFDASAGRTAMASLNQDETFRIAQSGSGFSGSIYRAGMVDGQMVGAAMTNIMIYQNRELIAQAVTDERGEFTVDTLAPGQYGVVAIGPDGFGVAGFNLVGELVASRSQSPAQTETQGRLVSLNTTLMQPSFQMQLAPSGLESPAIDELLQDGDEPPTDPATDPGLPVDPASMTGPGGGGGSGGGGGGGGSGIGLLGVAGVGLGIAAIASNDDDDGSFATPPVISPITP